MLCLKQQMVLQNSCPTWVLRDMNSVHPTNKQETVWLQKRSAERNDQVNCMCLTGISYMHYIGHYIFVTYMSLHTLFNKHSMAQSTTQAFFGPSGSLWGYAELLIWYGCIYNVNHLAWVIKVLADTLIKVSCHQLQNHTLCFFFFFFWTVKPPLLFRSSMFSQTMSKPRIHRSGICVAWLITVLHTL